MVASSTGSVEKAEYVRAISSRTRTVAGLYNGGKLYNSCQYTQKDAIPKYLHDNGSPYVNTSKSNSCVSHI